MDENEQNNFGFDGGDLSAHEQALINAVNQGKNLSQAKGSSSSLPSSVQKSKKPNFIGNMVSSFAKNAAAFVKNDSGGPPLAMLDRTSDSGSSIRATTEPKVTGRIAGRAADASASIRDGVAGLGGGNSATVLTPFQRQELLIFNRIKDDVSEIVDLLKDLDGKPSSKGTTDILKGQKENKSAKDGNFLTKTLSDIAKYVLGDLVAGLAGAIGAAILGALAKGVGAAGKGVQWVARQGMRAVKFLGTQASRAARFIGKQATRATKFLGKQAPRAARFLGTQATRAAKFLGKQAPRAANAARNAGRNTMAWTYRQARGLGAAGRTAARNVSNFIKATARTATNLGRNAYSAARRVGAFLGNAGKAAWAGTKAVGRFAGKAARVGAKFAAGAIKLAGRATAAAARTAGRVFRWGLGASRSIPRPPGGFGAIGRFAGRAFGAADVLATGYDVYKDYQQMQKHKDSSHQIGGMINMGLDVISGLANRKPTPAGAVIGLAAHMLHTVNTGYMSGPKGKQLEAGIAAWGNEQSDFGESIKNMHLDHQDTTKGIFDAARYGYETNAEKRDGMVARLSGRKDKKSLAEMKRLKSLQLVNKGTFNDYDFGAGNLFGNLVGTFTGSADNNFGNVFHNLGDIVGSHIPKSMPQFGMPQFPHIPSLPNAASVLQGVESAAGKAITTITAPLTQTFSTVFNNTTIFSKDEVKKAIDEILRQEHQAADMAKRASERFSNLNNTTLNASKQIAIRPGSALA